jgi:hypothetical protein
LLRRLDVNLLKVSLLWTNSDLGMLSHQQGRNDISGKKTIILNPTMEQKNGTETVTFAEGVMSSNDISDYRKYTHWIFLCLRELAMHVVQTPVLQFSQRQNRLIR